MQRWDRSLTAPCNERTARVAVRELTLRYGLNWVDHDEDDAVTTMVQAASGALPEEQFIAWVADSVSCGQADEQPCSLRTADGAQLAAAGEGGIFQHPDGGDERIAAHLLAGRQRAGLRPAGELAWAANFSARTSSRESCGGRSLMTPSARGR